MRLLVAALPWLALQGAEPELRASVDRDQLSVGDELVYSVQAVSRSASPLQVRIPTVNGFEVVGRTERSSVSHLGGPSRATTLELRLRALRAGTWVIGPAKAVQDGEEIVAPAISVKVDEPPGVVALAANPALRSLLDRAAAPAKPGEPAVSLALSARRGAVGEQLEVLTAAWFPRELRVRLRRPPTLQPPVIEGVWSYPQPVPSGIAATRLVGGTLYDLFVAHQVVFPLRPGRIVVAPAVLKYSVPLALQFFSQEERYTLTSAPETLTVAATPVEGRPAGYAGAVGRDLRLSRSVEPATARAGEPVSVAFELAGEGNPALWPAPEIDWPEGVRAYPDRTDESPRVSHGRLGGAKTFRFTVVPDSTGTLALPGARYDYYDVAAGAFRSAALPADRLVVAPGSEALASRPLPPALLASRGVPLARRVAGALPFSAWLLLLAAPPAVLLGRRMRLRRRRRSAAPAPPDSVGLEAEVETLVRELAPAPELLADGGLVAGLRAAGVPAPTATRLVAVRDRLRELRFGPAGGSVPPELAREARELLEVLRPHRHRTARVGAGYVAAGALLLLAVARPAAAQAPDPASLYERGALYAAASGFARQVDREPRDPAAWYNLGATYYRLGQDGRAAAAWLQARRLAPRDRTIARALDLAPPPEAASAGRLWAPPVAWVELALVALGLWAIGWVLLVIRPRRRELAIGLVLLAVLIGAGALALHLRDRRALGVLLGATPLQLSPHERAPTLAPLEPGSAVLQVRRQAGWALVNAPGGRLGWVPADSVFLLRSL
ncbi:MAG TPA: BatD family protein [Gemmatimonadales bacterium]|nr:BatD family protein [Gemmatimonadales bacterium]